MSDEFETAVAHCDGCDSDGILPSEITFDERHDPLVAGGCGHRITNPTAERLRARVAELTQQLAAARAEGPQQAEGWAGMANREAEIRILRAQLQSKQEIIDSQFQQWQTEVDAWASKMHSIGLPTDAEEATDAVNALRLEAATDRHDRQLAEARAAQVTQALDALRPYVQEVMDSHADPKDRDYNECDQDRCAWCDGVLAALGQGPGAEGGQG